MNLLLFSLSLFTISPDVSVVCSQVTYPGGGPTKRPQHSSVRKPQESSGDDYPACDFSRQGGLDRSNNEYLKIHQGCACPNFAVRIYFSGDTFGISNDDKAVNVTCDRDGIIEKDHSMTNTKEIYHIPEPLYDDLDVNFDPSGQPKEIRYDGYGWNVFFHSDVDEDVSGTAVPWFFHRTPGHVGFIVQGMTCYKHSSSVFPQDDDGFSPPPNPFHHDDDAFNPYSHDDAFNPNPNPFHHDDDAFNPYPNPGMDDDIYQPYHSINPYKKKCQCGQVPGCGYDHYVTKQNVLTEYSGNIINVCEQLACNEVPNMAFPGIIGAEKD